MTSVPFRSWLVFGFKMSVFLAVGGLLAGASFGWRTMAVATCYSGVIGGLVALVLSKLLIFRRGLVNAMTDGILGGAFIGFWIGILVMVGTIGFVVITGEIEAEEVGRALIACVVISSGVALGTIAGAITAVMLSFDTNKKDQ